MSPTIRPADATDDDAIWAILEPVFRAGETYPIPRDISRADALAYWRTPGHEVFVADHDGKIAGTYYLRANQRGGGAHVANCGYMTATGATGRGIAGGPGGWGSLSVACAGQARTKLSGRSALSCRAGAH